MRASTIALLAAVALALPGCGGSGGGESDSLPRARPAPAVTGAAAPAEATVVGIMRDTGAINFFYAALLQARLNDRLSGPGPFTVFVPSNISLAAKGPGPIVRLLRSKTLPRFLLSHVAAGRFPSRGLKDHTAIETLAGTKLEVGVSGRRVTVSGRRVIGPDVVAGNGIVVPIDGPVSGP